MAGNQDVSTKLKETLDLAARSFEAEKSEGYNTLHEELEELETAARKSFQNHEDCKSLVSKLEKGAALSSNEMDTLKLMMIGDADYYLKYDDDFERSEDELKRIIGEIGKLQAGNLDVDALMHLRVLCREASSVAVPTAHYLEQKERVRKFEEATKDGIDDETGKALANIVRSILSD
jgi:hypothetical protein